MPPKVRITREMIVDAAFQLVRDAGAEELNARAVAQRLNCSTQPVMYNFATVEQLRQAVYEKADEYHTQYLFKMDGDNSMLAIGRNYIRFAAEEPRLFRFLFQSNHFKGMDMRALIRDPALEPLLELVVKAAGTSMEEAQNLFRRMFVMAHGYASLLANNAIEYDEAGCTEDLEEAFRDAFQGEEEKV